MRAVAAFVGTILGGMLGAGCGLTLSLAIGASEWPRAEGFLGDASATVALLAISIAFCIGAVTGGLMMMRMTR